MGIKQDVQFSKRYVQNNKVGAPIVVSGSISSIKWDDSLDGFMDCTLGFTVSDSYNNIYFSDALFAEPLEPESDGILEVLAGMRDVIDGLIQEATKLKLEHEEKKQN